MIQLFSSVWYQLIPVYFTILIFLYITRNDNMLNENQNVVIENTEPTSETSDENEFESPCMITTESNAISQDTAIILTGKLYKRGASIKNWKLRQFTLTKHELNYHDDSGVWCGSFMIRNSTDVYILNPSQCNNKRNSFCISDDSSTSTKSLFLQALSSNDREMWIREIKNVVSCNQNADKVIRETNMKLQNFNTGSTLPIVTRKPNRRMTLNFFWSSSKLSKTGNSDGTLNRASDSVRPIEQIIDPVLDNKEALSFSEKYDDSTSLDKSNTFNGKSIDRYREEFANSDSVKSNSPKVSTPVTASGVEPKRRVSIASSIHKLFVNSPENSQISDSKCAVNNNSPAADTANNFETVGLKYSGEVNSKWNTFLKMRECIMFSSLTVKKNPFGLPYQRQLILTDTPRIFYLDPVSMSLKGEIDLFNDKSCSIEKIDKYQFKVKNCDRYYKFEDSNNGSQVWIENISKACKQKDIDILVVSLD